MLNVTRFLKPVYHDWVKNGILFLKNWTPLIIKFNISDILSAPWRQFCVNILCLFFHRFLSLSELYILDIYHFSNLYEANIFFQDVVFLIIKIMYAYFCSTLKVSTKLKTVYYRAFIQWKVSLLPLILLPIPSFWGNHCSHFLCIYHSRNILSCVHSVSAVL